MPINENVLDALAHILHHFSIDHPERDDVGADELAAYALAHGACADCCARFARQVGADTFAAAIQRVFDSEAWQAFGGRDDAETEGFPW
jgi:hypothetical protein